IYDHFIRRIVHDMRNPLAGIIGHAANLRHLSPDDGEGLAKSAAVIENEAQRLARLVDSMLFDARLAYIPLTIETFDVMDIVEEAMFAHDETAAERDVSIEVQAPPEALPFSGDRDLLVRAVSNLIDNSIKYSGEGGQVLVRVGRKGTTYLIAIRDNGPGIPPDYLPDRIFEAFVRAGAGGNGSGLGLSIVRKIARMHGGDVQAKSALGEGTQMLITLPASGEANA
ncbi:MAG: HAMP domain-containing sensor histidine kinase, partial [Chloroflexota bacterium]